jgi:N-ethylmaleimide reductase
MYYLLLGDGMFSYFRPRCRGTLIAYKLADLVAFCETFIANPDLPARFAALAPIARSNRALHYTPGPHGYTDYPPYQPATETQSGEHIA